MDEKQKIAKPITERGLNKISVDRIINKIRDSGILTKSCEEGFATDYSADYLINLDGVKKEFKFPGCRLELKEIDKLIDSAS